MLLKLVDLINALKSFQHKCSNMYTVAQAVQKYNRRLFLLGSTEDTDCPSA